MNKGASLLFAFIAFLLIPERLSACQCVAPKLDTEEDFRVSVSTSLNRADAVFSGEVTEIDRFKIKFKVQEVWKGDIKEEVTLVTGAYIDASGLVVSSRCGAPFEFGKSYLVFARGSEGGLQVERCSWTGILGEAGRVVGELDRLKQIESDSQLRKAIARGDSSLSWRNLTTHSTGALDSLPFIENLDGFDVVCAPG
jgi:hypothetical protein